MSKKQMNNRCGQKNHTFQELEGRAVITDKGNIRLKMFEQHNAAFKVNHGRSADNDEGETGLPDPPRRQCPCRRQDEFPGFSCCQKDQLTDNESQKNFFR